jgi:hypothetical protein
MRTMMSFEDWVDKSNESIYNTKKGVDLSMGCFHAGTGFYVDIYLDIDSEIDLRKALKKEYTPVFKFFEGIIDNENNKFMNVRMAFEDWKCRKTWKIVSSTEESIELSHGDFHHGSIFEGKIELYYPEDGSELKMALDEGFMPVFSVFKEEIK